MILSLFMAVIGSFTAIQFVETLVQKKDSGASHTSKKGSALFSVFAAAWCIGVNCVWVMHFLAMSAGVWHLSLLVALPTLDRRLNHHFLPYIASSHVQ
jgi:hypothetical protein